MKDSSSLSFSPAAPGSRLRFILLVTLVVSVLVDVLVFSLAFKNHGKELYASFAAVFIGNLSVAALWFTARIQSYEIHGQELRIKRRLLTTRFPLQGLVSAEPCPQVFKGARKKMGNDGLGAISGTFSSKILGEFRVYLTDSDKAVLLKLADGRAVVVSPEHVRPFIESVKKRAG